jgi:hypothetical protein
VSIVLNMISNLETAMNVTAAQPRPRFGLDACLPAFGTAATPASTCAVVFARPRTPLVQAAADAAWQQQALAAVGQAAAQQLSSKQSMYSTRIIATGGGVPGSHPAREPV